MADTEGRDPEQEARREAVAEQLSETKEGRVGATASPADEQPVRPDEVSHAAPDSPGGVGESASRRGEDVGEDEQERGRADEGTTGASERPVGTSDARDSTGVDPQESSDESPTMPTGDQGG